MGQSAEKRPSCTVVHAPLLAELTSLRLGGSAIAHIQLDGSRGAAVLPRLHKELGGTLVPFGRGTNILAQSGTLPLVLVSMAGNTPPEVVTEEDGHVLLRVDAGLLMPRLLTYAASQGFSGLEGLSGIPGSVGGAVSMNAGSYGTETGALLHSVTVYAEGSGVQDIPVEKIEYGYRKMHILSDGQPLVLSVLLRLTKKDPAVIRAAMRSVLEKKAATQPLGAHSAGCIFKNPATGPGAGQLLDSLGFKGKRLGGMEFSGLHANFLVNTGKGTSEEAFALIEQARLAAQAEEVLLETEVCLWP